MRIEIWTHKKMRITGGQCPKDIYEILRYRKEARTDSQGNGIGQKPTRSGERILSESFKKQSKNTKGEGDTG